MLARLLKIDKLFYPYFHAVNPLFLEQAIQLIMLAIVEMIKTGYQIPSDSANNGGTILDEDFRKWRFRIALVNHYHVLLISLNDTMRCIQA